MWTEIVWNGRSEESNIYDERKREVGGGGRNGQKIEREREEEREGEGQG